VLALILLPPGNPVRRGRLADLIESAALLALPPALVVATGVLSTVRS
jgi:hypothetical protein